MAKGDPWCDLPSETINISGVKVTVQGLSVGELQKVTKGIKDPEAISMAVLKACCIRADGVALTPEKYRPDVYQKLNEVVSRVNGFDPGNSSATGGLDSSSD